MKIRKLKLENHPFFGNFEIDFTNNGKTVDNIIIAGENGCGKSQLLNLIFLHSRINLDINQRNEKRHFEIELTNEDVEAFSNIDQFKPLFDIAIQDNRLYISIDYSIKNNWSQVKINFKNKNAETKEVGGHLFAISETIKSTSMIFSDIEINYTPKKIQHVTSTDVDALNGSSVRSSQNLATEIAQLFVDMVNSDAIDYSTWSETNRQFDGSKLHKRLDRFTSAFNQMFTNKKFKEVRNRNNSKDVIFTENGNETTLEQLSSGEKQIIFRGSFLLKDVNSLKGALVLIDEPEISLHPNWQMKIMDFYKNIFTDTVTGIQTSQIVVVTHSPFIIHNPNRSNDKVIILKKDSNGQINVSHNPEYYSWTNEELVKEAFNIDLSSTTAQNIVFVEGQTDEQYLKKCLEITGINDIDIKCIGSVSSKGSKGSGEAELRKVSEVMQKHPYIYENKKIVFLFDCDVKEIPDESNNIYSRKMTINVNSKVYKKGIENLLLLPFDFDYDNFYSMSEKPEEDGYGGFKIIKVKSLDKTKLCSFLCREKNITEQQQIFTNIINEIFKLKTIFGTKNTPPLT